MSSDLVSISELNSRDFEGFSKIIELLFEPAPPLSSKLYNTCRPFDSYKNLLKATDDIIKNSLTEEEKIIVINAHPRIGEKKQNLSKLSLAEQGNEEDQEILNKLKDLNERYEAKHGFKFVVFVNGRSKSEIVPVFESRLNNPTELEMETGLRDMVYIAESRLEKLSKK
ncbi:hypothetical protein HDU92_003821 [Lobulomyces angularis]|nr:hypothetical protein HDU92_003821 [Lobulomyces angularis]